MSRIIVKSLPKKITDEKLKEIFSEKGEVTDVQLKFNNQGKFRCFAFVGFKTDEEATEAREYFNNTYIWNCKIKVEICKNEKNDQKEDNQEKEDKIRPVKEEFEELKEDAEFLEFLKVQRNVGDTKKIWSDDVIMSALAKKYLKKKQAKDNEEDEENEENGNKKDKNEDKKDKNKDKKDKNKDKKDNKKPETIFQYSVAIRKIPQTHRKKKEIKDFFAPLKPISIRIPKIKCLAYVSFRTESELKQALEKHKSFMGQNQVHLQVLKFKDSKATNIEFNSYKGRIEKNVPFENIEEYGRLFLRNLNYQCTVEDLEELFKKYGPTTEISLPIDSLTQKIKGFAFVTFMFPEHAKQAFKELDRTTFQGRLLHIIPAELKDKQFNELDDGSFKKRKNSQLKNESTKQTSSWNTLFLGQNAVANILSKKLNIEKSDFFKTSKNDSLAARIALGETQLVNETRMFLEKNGVFLTSFDFENIKRSKTIFLIKNLPSDTTETELKEFLSNYGRIKKLILPPSCVTAIVDIDNQQVAFDMFKKLAYKKFKNVPLYLEWAPVNVLDKNAVDVIQKVKEPKLKKFKKLEYAVDEEMDKEGEEKEVEGELTSVINKLNEETENKEDEIENKKDKEPEEQDNPRKSYKILVKNVPFEATVKDVKQLFGAFGDLQFVRLPKKLHGTGSHRGFAFVEYVNRNDATKAFKSLSQSTHLYGRRLVLEYAKSETSSDDF